MILVFDTNVFIQKNSNLNSLFQILDEDMSKSPPRFLFFLDKGGVIEGEYLRMAEEATASGDYEADVRKIWELIAEGSPLWIKKIEQNLSFELQKRLAENECDKPIEPQLFGVAECADGVIVCPDYRDRARIKRGYLVGDTLQKIQREGLGPAVLSIAETVKILHEPCDYSPASITALKSYLSEFSIGEKASEERPFHEFKCPKNDSYLGKPLLQETVRAICGFLNTRNGFVFIGVDDKTGKIKPFRPKYLPSNVNFNKEESIDLLMRDIRSEIDLIYPKPGQLVDEWALIDKETNKCVVVIHVRQGRRNYYYRDKKGRLNRRTKWVRTGFSTVPDPNDFI